MGRIGGPQRLRLTPSCIERHGTIMHEFLHALGLHHEQKRGDRTQWVLINYPNIEEGKKYFVHKKH